jgi:hypothetical protein
MKISYRTAFIFSIALTLLLAVAAQGQIVYSQRNSVSAEIIYQGWKLKQGGVETSLSQSAVPFRVYVPIANDWQLHLSSAFSHTNVDDKVALNQTISTLTDTQARVFRAFANGHAFASFGLVLPTGKTGYDSLEVQVTQLIADDYLNIPVKRVGEGFGVVAQVGGANQYADWFLYGASVTYNLRGSYSYFKDGADYNPGDELTFQVSGTALSKQASLDVDLSYRNFFADKIGGTEVFKNGAVVAAVARGIYKVEKVKATLTIAQIFRNKNSLQFGSSLNSESNNSNNNKSVVSGTVGYSLTEDVIGNLMLGYRYLSANDLAVDAPDYFGKSSIVSFGGGAEYRAPSKNYSIYGRIVISTGTADKNDPDGEIKVSGAEVAVGGRAWF